LAAHDISIVAELTGANCTVGQAQGQSLSDRDQYDRVQFSGHAGSASFDIDVSWCWPVRTRETVIIGTAGQIVWNQDVNTVSVCHNRIENGRAVTTTPVVHEYNYDLSPLEYELQHWVNCVNSRIQPSTGVAQALNVAKTIDQVHVLI
jgi:predicted dehydrogenase